MSRFTLTIGDKSIDFTEEDMHALDSALTAAIHLPGREIFRKGGTGQVSAILHREGNGKGHHSRMTRNPNTHLLTDLKRGPTIETDC